MSDYPTEEELQMIREWDVLDGVEDLVDYIEDIWRYGDWGVKLSDSLVDGKKVKKLELHTGGWSGNEDIVVALQQNLLFWVLYWQKSTRGGHYWFEITKPARPKNKKRG